MIVTDNSRWDAARGLPGVPEVLSGLCTSQSPQLSVIIPVFNEADNCGPLLTEITDSLANDLEYEIIVVDDASEDATYSRLRDLRRDFSRLRVLRHAQNSGQSAALLTGVRAARAPWVSRS